MNEEPLVSRLSRRQLAAYNRADVAEFCACYHPDIEVFDETGQVQLRGIEAFRARYAAMFDAFTDVRAEVDDRLVLSPHIVEREHWSRTDRVSGSKTAGTLLVRYTEREGLIRIAEFLRP